jgi:ribokinase
MSGVVVVVGSFNVDHVWTSASLPRPGETLAGGYASGPGGKGFNQAVAAARAGAVTAFLCALGDDAGARMARELAATEDIALFAMRSDQPTGTAGIFVDGEGRNCIVLGPGANAALAEAHVAAQQGQFDRARIVLAQMEVPAPSVAAALATARRAGATTLLNPAPANVDVPAGLLALADVLTPNETEFAGLLERHGIASVDAEALASLPVAELHELCRRLLPGGSVVLTLGAAGCVVSHADGARHGDDAEPPCYRVAGERVRAIDTTGAGDAFSGALAASLATHAHWEFARHARFAGRYAALSTESAGAALAMPRLADVEARFAA